MTLKYFNSFPKISYDIKGDSVLKNITDLTRRVKIRDNLNDLVIIAFRGTEGIWEWLKDFDAPQDNFTFGNTSLIINNCSELVLVVNFN